MLKKLQTRLAQIQVTQITLTGLLLLAFSIPAIASVTPTPREAMEHFFHQSFNNLQEEAELAREEGKIGILVMFNDPDCPWCKKMKATVLNQVPVQEFYRKHFRILHLDTRGDTMMTNFQGEEIAEKDFALLTHRVRATPVFMFFDLDGNVTLKYTGATRSVDEFLWMGEFILNGEYKNTKFSRYKSERLSKSKQ
jgi:thioredoxin-related protein